jgi:NAD(P)-dependent dehydrogenase (short-subunit alcohol dehydrogenase family)
MAARLPRSLRGPQRLGEPQEGKHAWGLATARLFAAEGASVVLANIKDASAETDALGSRCMADAMDVADAPSVDEAHERGTAPAGSFASAMAWAQQADCGRRPGRRREPAVEATGK